MKKNYLTFFINKDKKGEMLQTFLRKNLKESLTLKTTKQILEKGFVYVNDKIERYGSYKLKANDKIKVFKNYQDLLIKKTLKKINILFEDEYFLVIDKPINFICTDKNIHNFFKKKYTLIHRLDKDTTGCLLIAKNKKVKEKFIDLFKNHKIDKDYIAIVDKILKRDELKIEKKIDLLKKINNQSKYKVSNSGKYALTIVKVLKRYTDRTLVLLKPITGRTHQIRVHLNYIKHPILADTLYAKSFFSKRIANRLMLHSYKISFLHPYTHKKILVSSKPLKDIIEICPHAKDL
ncbi:MAG: Ribosomal large subunit pseudouridine synthase C [Candidatus Anoxychlamydiales bacterium]|nr:Ribosomal large subunit pseudouridine synthase C [Candidatus Anoxychlamydiales bacterium]